ncbi:MAG: hypothetical protein ACI9NY_002216, partial [Kiritimatiellia bacterium]
LDKMNRCKKQKNNQKPQRYRGFRLFIWEL